MTTTFVYRNMTREKLDAAYNSDAAVPEHSAIMQDLRARSATFRQQNPTHLDLPYGPPPSNKLDFFAAQTAHAPTVVFFHGGNWRSGAKESFAALATGPLACGFNVAIMGTSLAPAVDMATIVREARTALHYLTTQILHLSADEKKIILCGWSAGAQLAALCLNAPAIMGGVVVSGLFDLEPIRLCYLNQDVHLTEQDVALYSPSRNIPRKAPPMTIVCGADETTELVRQSTDYAEKWLATGLQGRLVELNNHHHFSLLREWEPAGQVTLLLRGMADLA